MKRDATARGPNEVEDRLFTWPFILAALVMIFVVVTWPLPYDFLADLTASEEPTAEETGEQTTVPNETKHQPEGADQLEQALLLAGDHARRGERRDAHRLYQKLLGQVDDGNIPLERRIGVLVDAAGFYAEGNEGTPEQVEKLLFNAYVLVKRFPDAAHNFEPIHLGLEELYLRQGRYLDAADQMRALLSHYQSAYGDQPDMLYFLAKPTTLRLAQHLLAAGNRESARGAYKMAIKMVQRRGESVSAIEELIAMTYPGQVTTSLSSPVSPGLQAAIGEIATTGVKVEGMRVGGDQIAISGYAENNKQVARYLRMIQGKGGEPELKMVRAGMRDEQPVTEFAITVSARSVED